MIYLKNTNNYYLKMIQELLTVLLSYGGIVTGSQHPILHEVPKNDIDIVFDKKEENYKLLIKLLCKKYDLTYK